jgi:hypothetical protein
VVGESKIIAYEDQFVTRTLELNSSDYFLNDRIILKICFNWMSANTISITFLF